MFDRPATGEAAVVVALDLGAAHYAESLHELKLLASSAGLAVRSVIQGKRERPDARFFAGTGKVEEIGRALADNRADIALFNHELSPAQQRNLEGELKCRVVDRTTLILDIFAQRAKSHEGKVQVELAQLQHLATRFADTAAGSRSERALNQAARSLLLAQSSDWPFIMKTGTAVDYAYGRVRDHLARFHVLCDDVEAGAIDVCRLRALEAMDTVFAELDFRVYATE